MSRKMDEIIKTIFGGTQDVWYNDNFYKVIESCKNCKLIEDISKKTKELCYPIPHYPLHQEKRYRITPARLKAICQEQEKNSKGAREEAVERYIMKANGDELCNQWPVGNQKECVDLVYINENNEYSLIELKIARKDETKADSPLYAFIESIKNYCLVQNMNKKHHKNFKINELIILATKTYFEKIYKFDNEKFGNFISLIENFNKNNNIIFKLFYIDIEEEILMENIIKHENLENEDKHIRCIPCVKKGNWKEIDNNNWDKLCN